MGSAGLVALNQTVAVRLCQPLCNSHDSGKHSPVAQPLAILATLFDRIGRHGPAATIAGFALSPGTAQAISPRPGNATSSCLRSPYRNHARPRWLGPHRTGRSAGCALARCRDYHHTTNPCRQRAPLPRPQAESFVDGAWNLLGFGPAGQQGKRGGSALGRDLAPDGRDLRGVDRVAKAHAPGEGMVFDGAEPRVDGPAYPVGGLMDVARAVAHAPAP
jgi:hypothetical protein